MEEFLTPVEIAEILKLKKNTVYEMIKRGDLKATKLGKQLRITRSDFDAYLAGQTTQAPLEHHAVSAVIPKEDTASLNMDPTLENIIVCGQDTVLDKLCDRLNARENDLQMLRSHKGSYNALYALYNRQVHIATAHLWDPETDSYNLPYVSKLLPGVPVKVFHVLNRKQGFYVYKGNPKHISSFEDFKRSDLLFVNREPGCGTRILLDSKLMSLKINPSSIRGYYSEKSSHLDCATAVAIGQADFALGNERTSTQLPDIDFIPVQTESYDMVIPVELYVKPSYQKIVEMLRDSEFQKEVNALGGYDVSGMGKELL